MKKRNAAQVARRQGRQTRKTVDRYGAISNNYYNTKCRIAQPISQYLFHGKKNALSSSFLMDVLNIGTQRELRLIISKARENGEIILSNSEGYFLPADGEQGQREIVECVNVLRAKGISTLKAAAAIKKPLKVACGQESMPEIDALIEIVRQSESFEV